jgi:hypothetical protein
MATGPSFMASGPLFLVALGHDESSIGKADPI